MTKRILLCFILFAINKSFSQNFEWVKNVGEKNITSARSSSLDKEGNLYLIGDYGDTVDFDPGTNVNNLNPADLFITKYSPSGELIWAKSLGNETSLLVNYSIKSSIDSLGNLYLCSTFNGTCDFDPGSGIYNLDATSYQIFMLKLNPDGDFIWAKKFEGNYSIYNMDFDLKNNHLFLASSFSGTIDLDASASVHNANSFYSLNDLSISKYDLNGDYIANKTLGNQSSNEMLVNMDLDENESIFILADFTNSTTISLFDGSASTFTTNGSNSDAFLFKISYLDIGFGCDWVKQISGPGNESLDFDLLNSDNIIVFGRSDEAIDVNPNIQTEDLITAGNAFFCRYNNNGDLSWYKEIQPSVTGSIFEFSKLTFDNENNLIFLAGNKGTNDIDPGTNEVLASVDSVSLIITKYDSDGNYIWNGQLIYHSSYFTPYKEIEYDVLTNSFLIVGTFNGLVDFDPNQNEHLLLPNVVWEYGSNDFSLDMFFLKLNNNPLGIYDIINNATYTLHPNPVQESLFITCSQYISNYSIVDLSGKLVQKGSLGILENEINLKNLQQGTYMLIINDSFYSRFVKID